MATDLELNQMLERFGLMDGTRGTDRSKRAVRLADMVPLAEFPKTQRSKKAAGATPTKAEFDALVDDVQTVFRQLSAIADALRNRQDT